MELFDRISRVTSGGQAGPDRAALDVARQLGIPIGGWCPRGGWAEDFPKPRGLLAVYPELRETASAAPAERTVLNVRESHATVVVWPGSRAASPGTRLTVATAVALGRPVLVTDGADLGELTAFLGALGRGLTLNVGGPRESESPGGYELTQRLLIANLERPIRGPQLPARGMIET